MSEKELMTFYDAIRTTVRLSCDKCPEGFFEGDDEYDTIETAYEYGWRVHKNNVYCPRCARKRFE